MDFLRNLFGKNKKSKEFKCPKCGAKLKKAGDLDIDIMIKLASPEMRKDMEVQCWKCGARTTAADLVAAISL